MTGRGTNDAAGNCQGRRWGWVFSRWNEQPGPPKRERGRANNGRFLDSNQDQKLIGSSWKWEENRENSLLITRWRRLTTFKLSLNDCRGKYFAHIPAMLVGYNSNSRSLPLEHPCSFESPMEARSTRRRGDFQRALNDISLRYHAGAFHKEVRFRPSAPLGFRNAKIYCFMGLGGILLPFPGKSRFDRDIIISTTLHFA